MSLLVFPLYSLQLIMFWIISAIQLVWLAKSLPVDQDTMEAELAVYAQAALQFQQTQQQQQQRNAIATPALAAAEDNDTIAAATVDDSIVSIEDRIISFDGVAAQQTLAYVRQGIQEMNPFQQCSEGVLSMSSSYCSTAGAGDGEVDDSGSEFQYDHDRDDADDDEGLLSSLGQNTPPQHENWMQQQQQHEDNVEENNNMPTEWTPLFLR